MSAYASVWSAPFALFHDLTTDEGSEEDGHTLRVSLASALASAPLPLVGAREEAPVTAGIVPSDDDMDEVVGESWVIY
jgi:hypothetical protein